MADNHFIIGISGGSGSGKTSFVKALKEKIADMDVCFISMDNYYLPREKQYTDLKGVKNFDLPESINAQSLKEDLQNLLEGKPVEKLEYVFNNEKATSQKIVLHPAKIYIIEGLFIYHYRELKDVFDLKLYIHAKENLKLIRRIRRDRLERNYPVEDVIYRYEHHVMPSYEKYISNYKEDVDIVINNNTSFDIALDLVSSYIEKRLA
ncbi:MAG: uridine kinase [Saprospiraceae bacterium]|nr:uridine kinase [Saprospiraceae bacterium]